MKKLASVLLVPALLVNAVGVQSIFEFMPTAHAYHSSENPINSQDVIGTSMHDTMNVSFKDSALQKVLNEVISKETNTSRSSTQNITIGEMKAIKLEKESFDSFSSNATDYFFRKNIKNLEGIQYLVNVKTLNLGQNLFSSPDALEPLKDLPKLENLNLFNAIRNGNDNFVPSESVLQPIVNITSLKKLHLNTNALKPKHVSVLKDMPNLEVILLAGNNISNFKELYDIIQQGGFVKINGTSTFSNQEILIPNVTKNIIPNPIRDHEGKTVPIKNTTHYTNVDALGNLKEDGGYIKITGVHGKGVTSNHSWKNPKFPSPQFQVALPPAKFGSQPFSGFLNLEYDLPGIPEFESITESIENDTKTFAKTGDKIKVSLNLKQPATWKTGNTLEYCIGDDTSCAPSNGNYQNIGAFTKADTPEKTRNKTITVPAGVNGHLYYRNIVFQNKDGENMENNPTNYSVKTILVDTKAPTCGTPTYNPTTPTNGNVTVTFVPQDDGSGLAASTQDSCTISKNNESCEFKIFDKAGNEATCKSGVVTNIDKEKPVINGDKTKTFEVGSDDAKNFDPKSGIQTEAGATLTCEVNPAYDATKTGTYTVKCKAKDTAGNDSDEFVRTITISPIDKTPLNNKISATENLLQTDKKIVNDANKIALLNKLQDAKTKAQDQNLTKKQRDDLIAEITDLVNKLTRDKTAPKIDPIADKTLPPNQPITPINITTDDSTATINVDSTTLPPGLTFDPATNKITGTPTTPGTYTIKIKAKDPAGNESEQEFKITITSPSNNNGGNNTTKPTSGPGGGGFSIPTNPTNPNNNQNKSNNNSSNTNNSNNQNNTNIQKPIITPEGTLSTQHGVTPNNQTTSSGQKIYNLSGRITDYICPAIVQAYPYNELVVQDISNSSFQDDISALMMFRGMEKDEMNLGQTYEEYKKYGVVNNVTQFQPSRNVTRAEFVKMLVRSLSCRYTYLGKDTPFPDVDKNMWYAEYIKFAVENKWINGYKDGTFRPNAPITRDEAAKILARAIQLDTSNTKSANSSFSDVPNTSEFIPYIETLKSHGVMKGRNSNTFAPKEFIPRTETSRMIYRTFFGGKN
ncbi:MAG: S-layer homology domain-containing protein [Candidatus Altimarinota bacterium]